MNEETRYYPNLIQSLGLTGLSLLFMVLYGFIVGFVIGFSGIEYELSNPIQYILVNILGPVVAIGGVILYAVNKKNLDLNYIKGVSIKDGSLYFRIFLLISGVSIVISEADNYLQLLIPKSDGFIEMMEGLLSQNIVLVFIAVCIIAPIFEETLFRGIILRGLLKNINHWAGIFFSSLLFAVFHLNIWQGITAFITGAFIGWIFYKTGSLFTAIFTHFIVNFISLAAFRLTNIPGFSYYRETGFQPLWLTLIGVILLITGIILIRGNNGYIGSSFITKNE